MSLIEIGNHIANNPLDNATALKINAAIGSVIGNNNPLRLDPEGNCSHLCKLNGFVGGHIVKIGEMAAKAAAEGRANAKSDEAIEKLIAAISAVINL